jgi:hypothetical protein
MEEYQVRALDKVRGVNASPRAKIPESKRCASKFKKTSRPPVSATQDLKDEDTLCGIL